MKYLLIIGSFILASNLSPTHKDTVLKINENGEIIGLPKEFGPSKFDLKKNYLRIGGREIVLPRCINYYFEIHEQPELKLSASWYHSKDLLPYYINFDISKKNKDYGYKILIDLETLQLIYVEIYIKNEDSIYFHRIKLDDYCLEEYRNSIKSIKD